MRKKIAFTLLLWVASTWVAFAQNTIESIRKEYQNVHEWIAQMDDRFPSEGIPPEYFDLNVVQNLPATGPHHEHIRMYYGELESEEESDPYPPHYLCFATAKYNFAAREFYEEYLYDDKGQLMFIYALTPDVEGGGDIWPYGKATFQEEYSGKTIAEKYQQEAYRCWDRAYRFLTMFKGIDENTYL